MSECWKVPFWEYQVMAAGLKESEYSAHCFNIEDGMVIFRTKRERKLLEDVISWANDGVIPEREATTGEPKKKVAKVGEKTGPSIGQLILKNPHIITNLRDKNGEYLQGLCPSCATVNKDSDENHFWIHSDYGGYGCVSDCETSDVTRAVVKIMSDAGILESDTYQKPSNAELLAVRPIGKDPLSKEAANNSVKSFTKQAKLILDHIHSAKDGVTDEEGQDTLNIPGNSYRPARLSLERLGYITRSGETRPTHSGSRAAVWIAKMSLEQAELEFEIRNEEIVVEASS